MTQTKTPIPKAYQPYEHMTTPTLKQLIGMKKDMARQLDIEIAILKNIVSERGDVDDPVQNADSRTSHSDSGKDDVRA